MTTRHPIWQQILIMSWQILAWLVRGTGSPPLAWLRQGIILVGGLGVGLHILWSLLFFTPIAWGFLIGGGVVLLLGVSSLIVCWQCRDQWWPAWLHGHPPVVALAHVDDMTGHDFETYVAILLRRQGYQATVTPGSGDMGVDIIASKQGQHTAVQCKRQQEPVSRRALSDAVTGKIHYHCQHAMVVTNARFTKDAHDLAATTGCILVDRTTLQRWIATAHGGPHPPDQEW